MARQSVAERVTSDKLYSLLALVCKDEAASYVRTAEDDNGLQAWQAWLRATPLSKSDQFDQPPSSAPCEIRCARRISCWTHTSARAIPESTCVSSKKKNANKYQAKTSERLSVQIRKSLSVKQIPPLTNDAESIKIGHRKCKFSQHSGILRGRGRVQERSKGNHWVRIACGRCR